MHCGAILPIRLIPGRGTTMIRVIVADDESKVCRLICQLINWQELDMTLLGIASNGIETLEMIENEKPDLVITDVCMPGYDGLELIKKARSYNPDIKFIIISGHSQFEYAQTAIRYGASDYILKPVNRDVLNNTLLKVRKRYLEQQSQAENTRILQERQAGDKASLRSLLWMDLKSGAAIGDLDAINQKYYNNFQKGCFQTFLIMADTLDNSGLNEPYAGNILEQLYSKAKFSLQKQIMPLCMEFDTFCQNGQIIGVMNYQKEHQKEICDSLRNFIRAFYSGNCAFDHMRFHLSISEVCGKITELLGCFDQAERVIGQRLLVSDNIFLEKVPLDTEFDKDAFYKPFNAAMRKGLDLKSTHEIADAVSKLKSTVLSNSLNGYQILSIVKEAYHLFLLSGVFQNEYHFADNEELIPAFNKKAVLCGSAENLFRLLNDSCQKDLEDANIWIDKEKIRPINQAKKYIMENFAEDISLEDVSLQVGFSSSYFSTLFRKETGETFMEYLMEIRIEQAKKLLRESRIKIETVCKSVGYTDYKRFPKRFKKSTGISPKEYRNLYSGQG